MKITKIEPQKRNLNRYNLFIDDEFKTGIHEDVIVILGLSVGQEISDTYYATIIEKEVYAQAKNDAIHYISYRIRSEQEVIKKLKDKAYPDDVIEDVLNFLKEYNLIDDRRYITAFILDKMNLSKHSKMKIIYDLVSKGIPKDLIEEIFSEINEHTDIEGENIFKLLEKKANQLYSRQQYTDYEIEQKVIQFLAHKGFQYSDIKKSYDRYRLEREACNG